MTHLATKEYAPVQDIRIRELQTLLHIDGSATIYVSDVPPEHPDFAGVHWFDTLGGFHDREPADPSRPEPIVGQYTKAHPGHGTDLNLPVKGAPRPMAAMGTSGRTRLSQKPQ